MTETQKEVRERYREYAAVNDTATCSRYRCDTTTTRYICNYEIHEIHDKYKEMHIKDMIVISVNQFCGMFSVSINLKLTHLSKPKILLGISARLRSSRHSSAALIEQYLYWTA